jgi:hypothetical protein
MNALEKNEAHRWSYMTREQLTRRLEKITNPVKLRLFVKMARVYGERGLLIAANKKLKFFESNGVV